MSLRPTKVVAPPSRSRLDDVLRAGHRVSTKKYILWGNAKADWGIMYFDNYDRYMEWWKEWERLGWLNRSSKEPLGPDGQSPPRPPREYALYTKDYKRHPFDDYDDYMRAWEAAVENRTIYSPTLRATRDGGVEQFKNGIWKRIAFAH